MYSNNYDFKIHHIHVHVFDVLTFCPSNRHILIWRPTMSIPENIKIIKNIFKSKILANIEN